ncbi:MAG: hypothetical protein QOF76_2684, partial [Solirubrobacteraceae bacterium]|nr:hypothetical protein [Solirubrobacteraceae bacterium]
MRGRVEALGVPWRELSGTSGSLKLHPVQTPLALAEMSRAALAVRAVAHRVSADLIHANSVRAGLTAGGARSLGGPPVLTHVHDHLAPGAMTTVLGAALRAGSAGYLSISGWAESGLHGRPVHRIGNPVDIERFAPGGDRIDLPAGPHLGVLAQITPWKGQLEAVSALAVVRERHPEARLLLVGEVKFAEAGTRYDNRTYLRELHAHIAGLGLGDAVEFLGEREDAPDILRSLDVL